jgi:hypothetical protein
MQIVRRIGVMSLGKLMGITYGCLALVFMPFFLIAGGMAMLGAHGTDNASAMGGGIGIVVMALIFPVIYAVMGFVGGIIAAFIYNLASNWVGGIEIELAPQQPVPAVPVPGGSPTIA